MRGQAARKGKSSAIAMALDGIAHTMQRKSLDLKLEVFGVSHPDTVKAMADLFGNWYEQGRFSQAEPLAMSVAHFKRKTIGPLHRGIMRATLEAVRTLYHLSRFGEGDILLSG